MVKSKEIITEVEVEKSDDVNGGRKMEDLGLSSATGRGRDEQPAVSFQVNSTL